MQLMNKIALFYMQPYSLDQMSKNTREKGNWWHIPSVLGEISIKWMTTSKSQRRIETERAKNSQERFFEESLESGWRIDVADR